MRINHYKIILLVSIFIFAVAFLLSSCEINSTSFDIYVPEAANQFAVDKETEINTAEATKAHHIYKEIELKPEKKIVIDNSKFLTKIDYIRNHISDFENTTIEIEGMYAWYKSWDKTFESPMVYRNGPGCCGDDQDGGFYLTNIDQDAYEIDDWIRVTGKPFMHKHIDSDGDEQMFLFLSVDSIKVLPLRERKAEMVND